MRAVASCISFQSTLCSNKLIILRLRSLEFHCTSPLTATTIKCHSSSFLTSHLLSIDRLLLSFNTKSLLYIASRQSTTRITQSFTTLLVAVANPTAGEHDSKSRRTRFINVVHDVGLTNHQAALGQQRSDQDPAIRILTVRKATNSFHYCAAESRATSERSSCLSGQRAYLFQSRQTRFWHSTRNISWCKRWLVTHT